MEEQEQLQEIRTTQTDILSRLEGLENHLLHNGYNEVVDTVKGLHVVVMGDSRLGVPPMRQTLQELATAYERAKWIAIGLGITNAGAILGWIVNLIT